MTSRAYQAVGSYVAQYGPSWKAFDRDAWNYFTCAHDPTCDAAAELNLYASHYKPHEMDNLLARADEYRQIAARGDWAALELEQDHYSPVADAIREEQAPRKR